MSHFNYLVKPSRAKEIVVNVNKMRYFRQPALRPKTERRSVRYWALDKPTTLETYVTRYTGQDATTDHLDTDTNKVIGKSTKDTDFCGDA
jgi:hypothetical protein